MKKLFLFTIIFLAVFSVKAQTNSVDTVKASNTISENDEISPSFPGGDSAFIKYVSENLKYPVYARKKNVQGNVIVKFIIEKDGSLTDIKVQRSLSPETDKEAIRLVTNMPKWNPGIQNGHPVRVLYSVPISFRF